MEPQISAIRQADGTYTISVLFTAHNGCYSKGNAVLGPPASILVIPETFAITVFANYSEADFCTQALVPLQYQFTGVAINGSKSSITAFVVVHGVKSEADMVVASSSVQINAGHAVSASA